MIRALPVATLTLMLGSCGVSCRTEVVESVRSPDESREAVMFFRDCGATTVFSTQISIIETGEPLSISGNAFRADDNHGAARTAIWGGPWAEMQWLASDRSLIRYAANSRLFEQDDPVSGVAIRDEAVGN